MPRSSRIRLSPALLLAVSAALISLSSAQTCYVAQSGGVQKASSWKACPGSANNGFETCCLPGSECGEDMLCHIPGTFSPGDNQWYQAGCTDPTYQSSQCRKNCVYYSNPYVQYLTSSDEWNCCGDYGCNGTATQFSFKAAAPGVLTQIASLNGSPRTTTLPTPSSTRSTRSRHTTTDSIHQASSSSSRTTTTPTSSATTSTASTHRVNSHRHKSTGTTSTPAIASTNPTTSSAASSGLGTTQNQSSGGLSSGAKIGIGAAIGATGALAILAAVIACFVFRVKRHRSPEEMIGMKHMSDTQSSPSYRASGRQSELGGPTNGGYNAQRDTAAFLAAGAVGGGAAAAAAPPMPRQPEPSEYQRQTMFSDAAPMSSTGMAFNDPRGTRDWQSIKSSRHLSSIRTTRDYRFEDLPSRRDSIRTTRDYRFFAPEDENVPPLP